MAAVDVNNVAACYMLNGEVPERELSYGDMCG